MRTLSFPVPTISLLAWVTALCLQLPLSAQDLATVTSVDLLTANGGRVAWSANNLIAFDRRGPDGYFDIWLVNPDGSEERCLTCNHPSLPNQNIGNPSFHPTADWIVFQVQKAGTDSSQANPGAGTNNDVWVMALDGREATRLTNVVPEQGGVLHPHFSRQGDQLLWAQRVGGGDLGDLFGRWELHVADFSLEGNKPAIKNDVALRPGPQQSFFESNDFNPDGTRILYTANSELLQPALGIDQFWYDLETGVVTNLTNTPNQWDEHGHLSPAGSRIVWTTSRNVMDQVSFLNLRTDLWIMNASGGDQTRVTFFNDNQWQFAMPGVAPSDLDWSPDGKQVVVYVVEDVVSVKGRIMILTIDFSTVSTNAGSFRPESPARGSIISLFGIGIGLSAAFASSLPLPHALAGVQVMLKDNTGDERALQLFYSGPSQANAFIDGEETALGPATARVLINGKEVSRQDLTIVAVSPGVFTANNSGDGPPAGVATLVNQSGGQTVVSLATCPGGPGTCSPRPINAGSSAKVVLTLFATGLRNASQVAARIGPQEAQVAFAGPHKDFFGLDQVNVEVPANLIGSGLQEVVISADGNAANSVRVSL